jgi:hypothetical protein
VTTRTEAPRLVRRRHQRSYATNGTCTISAARFFAAPSLAGYWLAEALAILNEALWESGGKQARRLVGRDPRLSTKKNMMNTFKKNSRVANFCNAASLPHSPARPLPSR